MMTKEEPEKNVQFRLQSRIDNFCQSHFRARRKHTGAFLVVLRTVPATGHNT